MATRLLMLALLCTSQAAASRWQRIVKGASSLPSQQVLADGSPMPDGATPPQPRPMMGADSPALHTDRQLHIQVATEHLDTSATGAPANSTSHPQSFSDKQKEQSHVAERHRNSHKATVNLTADPAGTQPQQQAAALVSMERPASLALNVKGPHSPQVAQLLSRARQDLAHFENGISQAMVEQVYCTGNYQGFRLQIISNQLYVVGEVINPQWTGTHHRNLKAQLIELAERVDLPDVDLYINTHDWAWGRTPDMSAACPDQGPIISQSTHAAQPHVIPCPDFTFQDWQEAQTPSWELQEYIFHQAAVRHPWDTRVPELLFRGNLATGNRRVAQDVDWGRLAGDYDITFWNRPDDVGTGKGGYLSLPEHCHWKYLLNWPGNTYSGRLKSIMACGSTVVYPDNGFHEFWYHMLKSGENVIMMDEIRNPDDVYGRLTDVVHELKADDARAQRIGAAGKQLMEEVLTPDSVRLYWYKLISEYSQKMTFNVTKHPDAAPIGISITAPAPISLNEKTCDICGKHWPEGDPRDHWWEGRRRAFS